MRRLISRVAYLTFLHVLVFAFGVATVSAAFYGGYRRSGTTAGYYINSVFASSFRTAMQAADATWDGAGSKFRFGYAGTTSRNPNVWSSSSDGYSDIGYNKHGSGGTLATAVSYIYTTTGYISETDITFNTYYTFTTVGASGQYDVQDLTTHEFGHWLRLLDETDSASPSYCTSSSKSTMCQSMSAGDTYRRSLATDDKNGVKAIYGT